jgi:hypothetical protein
MDQLVEDQLSGLLVHAEEQQKVVDGALAGLKAESEHLARTRAALEALPDNLVSAIKAGAVEAVQSAAQGAGQSFDGLRASAEQTDAVLAGSVARFRKEWAWTIAGFGAGLCLLVFAVGCGISLWERHEIDRLTKQKEALEADVLALRATEKDFEHRGRRLIWNSCGGELCFLVSKRDQGWTTAKGERFAIPATTASAQ